MDSLQSTGLIPPGARVLAGYSGGADSTCLLHLLAAAEVEVVAAHLNHGQRPEADDEERRCADFADSLGVPFVAGVADVPALARARKVGIEEAGRLARYAFFESAAASTQCQLIATAHTLDDHVETLLLHLARGSGLKGLGGIPVSRGQIVRPLLSFRRAETRHYCSANGLWFHDDPTNVDETFARVRLRQRVVPELRKINPGFEEACLRLSETAREEDAFLDALTVAEIERCESPLNGHLSFLTSDCEVALDLERFGHLPSVLQARALRLLFEAMGSSLDRAATQGLLKAASSGGGSWTGEGGKVVAEASGGRLHVRHLAVDSFLRCPIEVPERLEVAPVNGLLEVSKSSQEQHERDPDNLAVTIDRTQTKGGLFVRPPEAGDRIRPLGMDGTKLLSDLFQESGLTAAARRRVPVVCDMVGPVWVPGIVLSERVKMTEHSFEGVRLTFGPLVRHPAQCHGTTPGVRA